MISLSGTLLFDIYAAFAAATVTVLLVVSQAGDIIRSRFNHHGLLDCAFCTSIWVSLIFTPLVSTGYLWLRVPAVVAVANIAILLITLSMVEADDTTLAEEEEAR